MKVFRNIINSIVPTMRVSIDGNEGGGGAPIDVAAMESSMTSILSGGEGNPVNPEDLIQSGSGDQGGSSSQSDTKSSDLWVWEKLKASRHSDANPFEIPQEITTGKKADGTELSEDDRFEMLINAVSGDKKEPTYDDPFIEEYMIARQDENFNQEEFFKSKLQQSSLLKLPNKDFYRLYMLSQKNEDGTPRYNEADVDSHINGLNAVDLDERTSQLKERIKAQQSEAQNKRIEEYKTKRQEALDTFETNRKTNVAKVLEEAKQIKNLAGIELSEAEINDFAPILDHMTSINPETGQQRMYDYLQSNNINVFKMLYLLHQVDSDGFKNHYSGMKEDIKQKILDKTGIKPNKQSLGGGASGGMAIPKPSDFV